MPITGSMGSMTYLRNNQQAYASDWWVAETPLIDTLYEMNYTNGMLYISFKMNAATQTSPQGVFKTSPDVFDAVWSDYIDFTTIGASAAYGYGSYTVHPSTGVMLATGAYGLTTGGGSTYAGVITTIDANTGSVGTQYAWLPKTTYTSGNSRSLGTSFATGSSSFYVLGNSRESYNSGTGVGTYAATFQKYDGNSFTGTPSLYRIINVGAATTRIFSAYGGQLYGNSIITGGYYNTIANPTPNVPFVMSINELTTNWAKRISVFNQGNSSRVGALAIDTSGNIYVTVTGATFTTSYVIKLDSSGNVLWSVYMGSAILDLITCDDTGCYVSGQQTDILAKIDTSGNVVYINEFTGSINFNGLLLIGQSMYMAGQVNGTGTLWKLPKDGSIPGTGTYSVAGVSIVYGASARTFGAGSVSTSSITLTSSSPAVGTINTITPTVDTTLYADTNTITLL